MVNHENPYRHLVEFLKAEDNETFQLGIVNLPIIENVLSSGKPFSEEYEKQLAFLDSVWVEMHRTVSNNGALWIMSENYFNLGELVSVPFDVATGIKNSGFLLRNIVVWYNQATQHLSRGLKNAYSCLLFCTKDKDYKFNLDAVREPHIWKDAEWGGGRRSRYNPKGKNPSNVWIKIISERGKIIQYVPMTLEEVSERCVLLSSDKSDNVLGILPDNSLLRKITERLQRNHVSFEVSKPSVDIRVTPDKENVSTTTTHPLEANRIFNKSSENMSEIPDASIQVAITSPPYWGLRDYGTEVQIGFAETYEKYLERLNRVWSECHRVLAPTGSLWININKRIINGNLLLFPSDVIKGAKEAGFYLKEIVIWHKPVFVPTTGPDNLTDRHEYVLFLAKNRDSYRFDTKAIEMNDYLDNYSPSNMWKVHRRIGNIGTKIEVVKAGKKIEHTAVYPDELVRRIILLCSRPGDVVLDPFAGSGTTISTANKLGRKWIGYELNPNFNALILSRLENEGLSLAPWMQQ